VSTPPPGTRVNSSPARSMTAHHPGARSWGFVSDGVVFFSAKPKTRTLPSNFMIGVAAGAGALVFLAPGDVSTVPCLELVPAISRTQDGYPPPYRVRNWFICITSTATFWN
jgi:hypothetical protein